MHEQKSPQERSPKRVRGRVKAGAVSTKSCYKIDGEWMVFPETWKEGKEDGLYYGQMEGDHQRMDHTMLGTDNKNGALAGVTTIQALNMGEVQSVQRKKGRVNGGIEKLKSVEYQVVKKKKVTMWLERRREGPPWLSGKQKSRKGVALAHWGL